MKQQLFSTWPLRKSKRKPQSAMTSAMNKNASAIDVLKLFHNWTLRSPKFCIIFPVLVFVVALIICLAAYKWTNIHIFTLEDYNEASYEIHKSEYLINNSGCKIPKLHPFDPTIKHLVNRLPDLNCGSGKESLLVVDNTTIRINSKPAENLSCFIQSISRNTENQIVLTNKTLIENGSIAVTAEFIQVECKGSQHEDIFYRQFYPFIIRKPHADKRIQEYLKRINKTHTDEKLKIVMLGLDSVSKNQFLRHMIKTHEFIKRNLTYVELHGYNKIGKNTYPNLLTMLTGKMEYEVPSLSKVFANALPLIWNEYMENGYRTMFSEDFPMGAIFNYARNGFDKQPVDYYLRPWSLAVEDYIKTWKVGCLNDRIEFDVILKWMEDLFDFFPSDPLFVFAFLTRMSHDVLNQVSYHDKPVRDLLQRLLLKGHLNNTVVFLFGDHGFRTGALRYTYVGRMEARLPFMFLLLPYWFPEKYPQLYNNFKINEYRLTTPLDIYATLKDLLYFRENSNSYAGKGRSISILRTEVPENRTCVDANIKSQWCSCINLEPMPLNDNQIQRSAQEIVRKINSITEVEREVCAELSLATVLNASRHVVELGEDKPHDGSANYLVTIKVAPSDGIFEGSVWFNGKNSYAADDGIERINLYRNQSACANINVLKPFCYCIG